MKSSDLKPQHQTNVIGQILDLCDSNVYVKECLSQDMEAWERKEYESILNENIDTLKKLKDYILIHKEGFEEILSQYKLSVAVFINQSVMQSI